MRPLVLAVCGWLISGCGPDAGGASGGSVTGTIDSLSPGGAPTLVTFQWVFDDGMGDRAETGAAVTAPTTLPASFSFDLSPPTHFSIDFEAVRALPSCSASTSGNCWPDEEPRLKGQGKLAIGSFVAFEDTDGNGEYTSEPKETIRGYGPLYVLYAVDLDAQALEELGERTIINPQALKPGFNFARVRCKTEVGWKGSFDPFEIVPEEPIKVESLEALQIRAKAGELCNNWS